MPQENVIYYNQADELDDNEIDINIQKIWKTIWSRRIFLIKIFCSVLAFFILLTFILPKKYKVTADLYINKSNNSNMIEINPYMLEDSSGGLMASMGSDKTINNEIELIKSELVLDKVIRDNNIVHKKLFGIIPNRKEGEYKTAEEFYKKGKILKIENAKNTNVISIEYKSKEPELAYGVVSSLISNYIELHKELNTEKSKYDKKLLESEYAAIKQNLNEKLKQSSGLPAQSMTGIGNLSAMSAFSRSASTAIGNLKSQYIAGEKSEIAVGEERQKLAHIASKLEWAKMVEQMSDSSKVLILKEPKQLRPFENASPKLLINIILGIIFGFLSALAGLIYIEKTDKKLSYSTLTNNIIYDGVNEFEKIKTEILCNVPNKVLVILLTQLPQEFISRIQELSNARVVYADLNENFVKEISSADEIMIISKLQSTNTDIYKKVQNIITKQNKTIMYDILI